jgi:hypothetical protein
MNKKSGSNTLNPPFIGASVGNPRKTTCQRLSRIGACSPVLHVRRVKQGVPNAHPLQGDEMRALRELKRSATSPFVFTSERGAAASPR